MPEPEVWREADLTPPAGTWDEFWRRRCLLVAQEPPWNEWQARAQVVRELREEADRDEAAVGAAGAAVRPPGA